MPLTFAAVGEENTIRRVGGNPETRKHLEDLGFVAGAVCGWCPPSGAI
jgi:ferrous iron transport protein A